MADTGARATEGDALAAASVRRVADVAFVVLLAGVAATVWLSHRFPSQDGPQHVESIVVWQRLNGGGALGRYFVSQLHLAPYWSTQLVLRGLLVVFAPATAERLLVTALIVGVASALRYALMSIDRSRGAVLAVLALPLATTWYLHMGFYGFLAGIASALWAAGYWIRHGDQPRPRHIVALAAIVLLSYASHLIGALLAILLVAAVTVARRLCPPTAAPGAPASLLAPLVAVAPTVALVAAYMATSEGGTRGGLGGIRYLFQTVAFDFLIASYRPAERGVSALLALTVWLLVLRALWLRRRGDHIRWPDVLLVVVPLSVIIGLVAPEEAAGGYIIRERLALLPALLLLLWLAAQESIMRRARHLLVIGAVLTVALAGMRASSYRQWSRDVDELTSVESAIPAGATVLPVTVVEYQKPPYFYRTQPMLYAVSWIAVDRHAVGLSNLDADTDYAPMLYRRGLDPYRDIDTGRFSHEGPPVQVDLDGLAAAGGQVDYVLLIGADLDHPMDADTDAFLRDLDRRYELMATSDPTHWVRLYRRRPTG